MADRKSANELERLLQEAIQRAEDAERERQDERRRAEKERQRAEDAERERQDERRRADDAERERQEERQRAEKERQRAEDAERERQEERQRAEKERQRADASEEETRPTTIEEYITACHTSVFSRFTIETDPKLSSRGSITNPRNKWCPKNLQPWTDFIHKQRLTFGTLNDTFPIDSRVFENRAFLAGLGDRVSQRRIADEKSLEYFLHNSVEDPVRVIIQQLKEVETVTAAFEMGDGIVFENHPHALSDTAEEVVERETLATPRTPDHGRDLNQLRPDQICVTRSNNEPFAPSTMVYISEYKSPCKLTVQHLRIGLRPMDIYKEVVNRKTIPTSVDPDALFRYHAERLTASAITQTYHYMIESGLEYGNLTIGEATVFLKIDWNEPETLLYHLAEPKYEVSAHPDSFHICTAVGQYLAFTLMALGSPGEQHEHGQDERRRVMNNLKTWAEDFETTLRSIPENERSASSEHSPDYEPTTYNGIERSPYLLRRRRRRAAEPQIDEISSRRDDRREPSDDESTRPPDTPTPTGRSTGQASRRSQRLANRPRGDSHQQGRQCCTQKCLLGLVRGDFLDPKCPNIALHCSNRPTQACHPVSHSKWLALLREQLKRSLDEGITRLRQGGSRGVLFKITLLAYGYTFLGKGTVRAFVSDLTHEAAVYDRLSPLQGRNVPVFLGAIDLRSINKVYYYFHRVYVVHMTLLSWGGDGLIDAWKSGDAPKNLQNMAIASLRAMHQEGVVHRDGRLENMLFNREVNRVMMIDFERASLVQPPSLPLAQLVPNKRKQRSEERESKKAVVLSCNAHRASSGFSEDIINARMVFRDLASPYGIAK
ncbi:hypothetical protein IWW34DRAFT_421099 [Fusarium oxysporum f. sp. albedinis]|nr:hypothetical protein IWW34DRAFT_421099 [Fusarium oxysporum f. sp. albedinis]KAJ0145450.1 hypothetical protein HZ326_11799 [Fusarium oxysporum f. sp. albedinis]KAK2471625.1 hypothetical protein H9L39_16616 [Fusarium oxysporum f. sp. albedinis]